MKICIVGTGIAGSACLMQLAQDIKLLTQVPGFVPSKLTICVIEKSANCGSGYPYSSHASLGYHLLNQDLHDMSYNFDGITSRLSTWVALHKKEINNVLKKERVNYHIDENTTFIPRIIYGMYLEECFNKCVHLLKRLAVNIVVRNRTEVSKVYHNGNHYTVQCEADGETSIIQAHKVVIATGHSHRPSKLLSEAYGRFFDESIPKRRLVHLLSTCSRNSRFVILGSHLSGLDSIRDVLKVHYKLFAGAGIEHNNMGDNSTDRPQLIMVSRNGYLPFPRTQHIDEYQATYFNSKSLKQVAKHNQGVLSIIRIWKILQHELDIAHLKYGLENPYQTLKDAIYWDKEPFERVQIFLDADDSGSTGSHVVSVEHELM